MSLATNKNKRQYYNRWHKCRQKGEITIKVLPLHGAVRLPPSIQSVVLSYVMQALQAVIVPFPKSFPKPFQNIPKPFPNHFQTKRPQLRVAAFCLCS